MGVGGTANATGGGPATGGAGGGGVATGGGPATGGVGGSVGHTGGVGGGTATGGAGGGPYGPDCHEDADCRLFSFLCTGCDCVVLGANDPDPHCSGPGVQCLIDPCMDQTRVCYMGTCQIETTSGCITQAGGEICNNEIDDDCDGLVDEGCTP